MAQHSVRLSQELIDKIQATADRRECSFSQAFRILVGRGLAIVEAQNEGRPTPVFAAPTRRGSPSMVYFIRCSVAGESRIKMGVTRGDPQRRIASFETGNPFPMTLLFTLRGGAADERRLHEQFAAYRLKHNREWFHETGELAQFIAARMEARR